MPDHLTLSITDESFSGKVLQEMRIHINAPADAVTIQDIIVARVTQEVNNYNNRLPEYFNGLVEPTDAERTVNGYKLRDKKIIDPEKQVYVALDAFQKNGFFVLVDKIQSTSLDDKVNIQPDTRISFVKLTPLVGG